LAPGLMLVLGLAAGACRPHPARVHFAKHYDCPLAKNQVFRGGGRGYVEGVEGCGRSVRYKCSGGRCQVLREDQPVQYVSTARATTGSSRNQDKVQRFTHSDGYLMLSVSQVLDGKGTKMRVVSAPTKDRNKLLFELSRKGHGTQDSESCALQLLLSGELRELGDTAHVRKAGRHLMRAPISRRGFIDLARSDHTVIRVCNDRWELDQDDIVALRRFAMAFQEELAVLGDTGGSGIEAPSGGWPKWRPASELQPSPRNKKLSSVELFQMLQPSVYTIIVKAAGGESQGSAVAVGKDRLLTNCHVLEGASSILLTGAGLELKAIIAAADPKHDRCVLQVDDGEVKPIAGVRAYSDLKVGEKVFSLGAPRGLEHSLSEGIISGKRSAEDYNLVQTTAAISPGSSGGGLFDEQGNLVGITTLTIVGEKRLEQSLNFAIAGDGFWEQETAESEAASTVDSGEEATGSEFDPDLNLSFGEVKLRLAGKGTAAGSKMYVKLLRPHKKATSWSDCDVRFGARRGAPTRAHRGKYRQHSGDMPTESLSLRVSREELLNWTQMHEPVLTVCGSAVIYLKGKDLKAVREAVRRHGELHSAK